MQSFYNNIVLGTSSSAALGVSGQPARCCSHVISEPLPHVTLVSIASYEEHLNITVQVWKAFYPLKKRAIQEFHKICSCLSLFVVRYPLPPFHPSSILLWQDAVMTAACICSHVRNMAKSLVLKTSLTCITRRIMGRERDYEQVWGPVDSLPPNSITAHPLPPMLNSS